MKQYEDVDIKKQCYVYPSGGCAVVCVNILKDCLVGAEFIMLDDREHKTSLEANKETIVSSGDYLLVCAGDAQEELFEKCRELGIEKSIDGREYTAFLLANTIKQETESQSPKFEILENGRVLHIFDNKWIMHFYYFYDLFSYYLNSKSFDCLLQAVEEYCKEIKWKLYKLMGNKNRLGIMMSYNDNLTRDIGRILIGYGVDILWWCNLDNYRKVCGAGQILRGIICNWSLIGCFVLKDMFLTLGSLIPVSSRDHCMIGIGHTLVEAFQFFPKNLKQENLKRYIRNYFKGFKYYIAIDKHSKESFKCLFENMGLDIKVLEGGSVSIDNKIKDFDYLKYPVEQFLFMPRVTDIKFIYEAIMQLLKHQKKVIFRPHHSRKNYIDYLKQENPYNIMNDFVNDNNFVFLPREKPLTKEILAKSIVITDNSSTGYSSPLSTLRPVILFAPPKKEFDLRVRNFGMSFENPILHRVALSVDECVDVALQLEKDLSVGGGRYLRESIKKYRDANLYNQGCAAEAIAEILKNIADGKI